MLRVFIILSFLSLSSFAEELRPHAPEGWVEMNSLSPVILTWAQAMPEKNLEDVPTLMIQTFKNNGKIKDFFQKQTVDKAGCFQIEAGGWKQTWCERKNEVFVILARGTSDDLKAHHEKLKAWVLTHD